MIRARLDLIGFASLLCAGLLAACGNQPSATSTPALSAPAVPTPLSVPSSQRPILKARGVGVQIYACRANPGQTGGAPSFAWTLKAPDSSLLDERGAQIGKNYEGPTWELNDGSKVVGVVQATLAAPGGDSIPWLLLKAVRNDGAGAMTTVRTIQRLDTVGGKAPASGCDGGTQDTEVRVPYEATYYFYADNA
jgi:hypothetical protein